MSQRKLIYPGRRFTVRGSFPFPVDMLRYDTCIPASEADSTRLANVLSGENVKVVDIELMAYDSTAPTPRRWEAHMWKVIP